MAAPTETSANSGMHEFDFGDVLSRAPEESSGIAPTLLGEYMIVLRVAGSLGSQPPGAAREMIDPELLHDILIDVGYGLA